MRGAPSQWNLVETWQRNGAKQALTYYSPKARVGIE